MTDRRHAFSLGMEDGSFWLECSCPYEVADESRPCWPCYEDGRPFEAHRVTGCNYVEWVENLSADEILHGAAKIPLPTAFVVWEGDSMQVHVAGWRVVESSLPQPEIAELRHHFIDGHHYVSVADLIHQNEIAYDRLNASDARNEPVTIGEKRSIAAATELYRSWLRDAEKNHGEKEMR